MKLLLFLFRKSKKLTLITTLLSLISGFAYAKLIAIVSETLGNTLDGAQTSWQYFAWVVVFALVTGLLSQSVLVYFTLKITHDLRHSICFQILQLSLKEVEQVGDARFTASFTQDITTLNLALLRLPVIFVSVAILVGCLVYLTQLSPFTMMILVGLSLVSVFIYFFPEKRVIHYMKINRKAIDQMFDHFRSLNQGAKELRLSYAQQEAFFNGPLRQSTEKVRDSGFAHLIIGSALGNMIQLMYFLFVGILLFWLPSNQEVGVQTVTAFALVALYMRGPIIDITNMVPVMRQATIAFKRAQEIGLDLLLDAPENPYRDKQKILEQIESQAPFQTLELKQITHSFYRELEEAHFQLGPVDLDFRKGELVFLVGGNGSGKTTLAKVITGLYQPASGKILLNGKPVEHENSLIYRQHFSAIFDDFFIFEQLLGLINRERDEQANRFLRKLQIDHKVKIKKGRMSTSKLSSGQRKRLALLVTFLENREICLFDEWAADQDPEFKHVFYRELLPELKAQGKTAIVISHDDRYFDVADRVVKMADGQILREQKTSTVGFTG